MLTHPNNTSALQAIKTANNKISGFITFILNYEQPFLFSVILQNEKKFKIIKRKRNETRENKSHTNSKNCVPLQLVFVQDISCFPVFVSHLRKENNGTT